ncbi:MAG: hypothetical protein HY672_01135 [Chloroflexi bacterium]|nr:hypothetical protein [Chloroflexota bacterium]
MTHGGIIGFATMVRQAHHERGDTFVILNPDVIGMKNLRPVPRTNVRLRCFAEFTLNVAEGLSMTFLSPLTLSCILSPAEGLSKSDQAYVQGSSVDR